MLDVNGCVWRLRASVFSTALNWPDNARTWALLYVQRNRKQTQAYFPPNGGIMSGGEIFAYATPSPVG